jgi:hypothetical protein
MSDKDNKTSVPTSVPPTTTPAPTATTSAPAPEGPKYLLMGDSIEELSVQFASAILKTQGFTTKDNASANGSRYAIWKLDDGLSSNPFSTGWGLDEPSARLLNTKDGAPAVLSIDVVMRQLTPIHGIKAKLAERNAAVASREDKLEAQLAAIRARKARENK